MTVTDSVRRD